MADANRDPIASSSQSALGWFEEVQPGVAPPTPAVTAFRRTGGGFQLTKEAYDSAEIRPDRMTADSRHGVRRAIGEVEIELSVGSYDTMFEALMGSRFDTGFAITGGGADFDEIASDATTGVIAIVNPSGGEAGFQFGDRITIVGVTTAPALNGTYTVVAAGPDSVTVAEPIPDMAPDAGTVVLTRLGRRLVIGNIYRTFGFEEALNEVAQFQLFSGCKPNSLALNLPPTGIATGTWNIQGQKAGPMGEESIDGLPPLDFTATNFGQLVFDGATQRITAAAGDFTTNLAVGQRIRFMTLPAAMAQTERKILTIRELTARVMTVFESIESDTANTYVMRRVSTSSYADGSVAPVLAAASGLLLLDGAPIATVTALSFTIDNGIAGATVVGSNEIPQLVWGPRQSISGQMTALFQEGGIYNKFEGEIEGSLIMRLDDPNGNWLQFALPRVKFNSAELDRSAAEGIPVTVDIVGLRTARQDTAPTNIVICTG